jgi:peptide/nickel transport system ATP-binding protein
MIADEPTTALDVTIQAQILDLMNKLKADTGASILFITHDLGVIAEMAQNVAVMYAGHMVEYADVKHSLPPRNTPIRWDCWSRSRFWDRKRRRAGLSTIKGVVPSLFDLPQGCLFSDRCPDVFDDCRQTAPEMVTVGPNHMARCLKYV